MTVTTKQRVWKYQIRYHHTSWDGADSKAGFKRDSGNDRQAARGRHPVNTYAEMMKQL